MASEPAARHPRKRATITDVARAAGVAASTVSRSFTNPGRVNSSTREHVLEVAAELGYSPNPMARALESGRTNTLALLVPDITNPYFAGVIKGAERAAAAAGRTLVLGDTQESAATEARLLQRLGPAVDGFVLSASRMPDDDLRRAAELNTITLVNRAVRGFSCVVADYDSGTRQIVDHLASFGHRSLIFLGGPPESWSGARRWFGLRAAAQERDMEVRRFGPYSPTLGGGAAAADAAVAAGATAVVCHNDMLALGVLRRLHERRVAVPEDISVVGFDNIFGSDLCTPTLTTLAERTEDAGSRAIEMLGRQTYEGVVEPAASVLPTQLVVRGSTGAAPS
ncbi:LacI family transcriptional regulator [Rhodococcus sp. HM1]|uniref:LacI family DNA-binding transcriptional regulator n=1 Tax=unclassified Rhodococcus (in: high G+C Gram-positive bacteria) TaxID=192944 RepID=UPI0018CC947E|nr:MULTISPECIES: LacI family DNA-binding transcriptional regulator [unclassified Rhodococcus (in: high G+C Gram-positive bacteria)]MBH0118511.1 LacI family DNA-binding transcriptional regulator [Rhodococcus sp. CX]MCK8672500.1 LacI family transcriptional regulator [Rhodococcus sp. HM1]